MDYKGWFVSVGNWIADLAILSLGKLGVQVGSIQAKAITLLIFLGALYLFIKVISIPKKPIKYSIIIILLFLAISITVSFFQ
jgi:hypothetical protein